VDWIGLDGDGILISLVSEPRLVIEATSLNQIRNEWLAMSKVKIKRG